MMGTLKGFASPSAPTSHPASPALRAASPNPPALWRSREGKGVVGEAPKHRRSRWAKPGSANAVMGTNR